MGRPTPNLIDTLLSRLARAHGHRHIPAIPAGFTAAVMAELQFAAPPIGPLERLLPRYATAALATAAIALLYGMALLDSVPAALASLYGSQTLGF
ncbi:MAG: hypothetical protein AB7D51_14140 [Desulfovibrionaceae bacterium]|jgi:hypothetical protein